MKRRVRASKSTFRAILQVQKHRDERSGLYVQDRFYRPDRKPGKHSLLWLGVDIGLLTSIVFGFLVMISTGFAIPLGTNYYFAMLAVCVVMVLPFHNRFCMEHPVVPLFLGILFYLAVLYWNQEAVLQGLRELDGIIANTLQANYSAENATFLPISHYYEVRVTLFLCTIPAACWLAFSFFGINSLLMANLLVFPLLAILAICGAASSMVASFLILFGVLLGMAFSCPKKQKRMWGGGNKKLFAANHLRFQSVQKKTAVLTLLAGIALSVPGFFLVRPLLALKLMPAEQLSVQVQSGFLNRMMRLLPELSAGQWKLNLEMIGGGVQDGAISSGDGYLLDGVEDLQLTISRKPTEPIFLKGYVGKTYTEGSWTISSGATFDGASLNWNTEGSTRLYIQNLPFLRAVYASSEANWNGSAAASGIEPIQLLVKRLNANDRYTYVPYGAFLNDYYQVESGDGAVAGQAAQEDRFLCFARDDLERLLKAWSQEEDTANVLDRVEESYRAFCQVDCTAVPDEIIAFLPDVRAVMAENKWNAEDDLDEITSWIRRYLAENYRYQLIPDETLEGEDPLLVFLQESGRGNSIHFASAAVFLYRMFGIPARYVVGYEIPETMFTVQSGGVYTATVQGDNSQAWAEVYIPGIGWSPRDMTPGVIGTLEEIGPGGIRVEFAGEAVPEGSENTTEVSEEETAPELVPEEILPDASPVTLEQMISWIAMGIGTALVFGLMVIAMQKLCRNLGLAPFGHKSEKQCLLGVFQAVFRRAERLKLPKGTDSQSETFVQFLSSELRKRDSRAESAVTAAMENLYGCIYGGMPVAKADIHRMRQIYLGLYRRKKN